MALHFSLSAGRAALLALACVLTSACGGGGDGDGAAAPATPAPASAAGTPITRVIVAGDSLADAGTFGFRATVQSAVNPATGYPVYPELVATGLGLTAPCNYFSSPDEGRSFTTNAGCTNYAVAASAVVNPVIRGGDNVPFSLEHQLETAVAANGGAWRPGDLVIVGAGGNDAAGLADLYLEAQGGGAEAAVYLAFLGQQLDASTLAEAATRPDGDTYAAGLYMEALARTFWTTVKANTLDRGATRVAVLNVPDLRLTRASATSPPASRFRRGRRKPPRSSRSCGSGSRASTRSWPGRWPVTRAWPWCATPRTSPRRARIQPRSA